MQRPWNIDLPRLLTAILFLLLVILAGLQYTWLERIAEADEQRTRAALQAAVDRFSSDFNLMLGRLFVELQPGTRPSEEPGERHEQALGREVAQRWQRWQVTAEFPQVVRQLYLLRSSFHDSDLLKIDADGTVVDVDWPREFEPMKRSWRRPRRGEPPGFRLLQESPAALLVPLFFNRLESREGPPFREPPVTERRDPTEVAAAEPEPGRTRRRGERRGRGRSPLDLPLSRFSILLHLDRQFLVDEVLPELAQRQFAAAGLAYQLRVEVKKSKAVVFETSSKDTRNEFRGAGDVEVDLFGPLEFRDRSAVAAADSDPSRARRLSGFLARVASGSEGQWRLVAAHPEGSLDAAVRSARRRNLTLSLGILALLAFSVWLLARTAGRSQRLAKQQLEFVAGITHELMTPLAALRSAGQNLADGVVAEPQQVARYGRLIDHEGHRLADMVGQVLAFAGMQTRQPQFSRQPVSPQAAVAAVLEDLQSTFEAKGVEVEAELAADLPAVDADPSALSRALTNLIANAVKYGQPAEGERWIGVRGQQRGDQVAFEVLDHGPGIAPRDRPHLFEPFYRGREMAASAVPGSGLGLSLVRHIARAHGGEVSVGSNAETGAVFTLLWPIHAEADP